MLFATGEDDVFNHVIRFPIYNSILPVWQHYVAMRADLNEETSTAIDLSTGVGHTAFTHNTPTAIKFFETNGIAQQLIKRAVKDKEDADKALGLLITALNEKVGAGIKMEPKEAGDVAD